MHWLDITLVILFALGAFLGARKGLLWQVARLAAFGLAIYACIHYHVPVAEWLAPYVGGVQVGDTFLKFLTYAVIFLGVVLGLFLLTHLIERFVEAARLKPLDRLLGAALGVVKAGLLGGTLVMGGALYSGEPFKEAVADSKIAPHLIQVMGAIVVAIPEHIKEELDKSLQRIKELAVRNAAERQGLGTPPASRRDDF